VEQNTPYFMARNLLIKLLEMDTCKTTHEKEEALLKKVTDPALNEKLPLLNGILNLKVNAYSMSTTCGLNVFFIIFVSHSCPRL